MKKLFVIVFTMVISASAHGQILNAKNGISISKLDWKIGEYDFSENTEPIIFYSFFAGLEYAEHSYFFLSSDLGYVRKGTNNIAEYVDFDGEVIDVVDDEIMLDYLSFNTTFNLTSPIKERLFPYISIGPRTDILMRYADSEFDTISELNYVNYGMILGGGIKYKFTDMQIGLCSNYNLNFNKVADWERDETKLAGEIQDITFAIHFLVGYIF